jgi:N-acetylglucosamine kinase-like BadF-type ATPase
MDADVLILLGNLASKIGEDPEVTVASSMTPQGLDHEYAELSEQIKGYLKRGEKVPDHIAKRRTDIFERKYK